MRYIYEAAKVLEDERDPLGVLPFPDLELVTASLATQVRWLALKPWNIYEADAPVPGATPAPATYKIGTPTDTVCDQPWFPVREGA